MVTRQRCSMRMLQIKLIIMLGLIELAQFFRLRQVSGRRTAVFSGQVPDLSPRSPQQAALANVVQSVNKIGKLIIPLVIAVSSFGKTHASVSASSENFPQTGYQMKSGLIYFDMNKPTGEFYPNYNATPKFGQFVSFYYTAYYLPTPDGKLKFLDSTERGQPFLQKHGNGRIIRGIEEALHTMMVGSKRRIIVPKQLGYTTFDLGPLPEYPSRRKELGKAIDLIDQGQGQLVYDLELVHIRDDENDQGYYEDEVVSAEEVQTLLRSIRPVKPHPPPNYL